MALPIKAIQKTSLVDFPPHVACTIFVGGCNFRCSFCHNPDLIVQDTLPDMDTESLFDFLKKRKEVLSGVCITGGEPTIYGQDLKEFIIKLKELGYAVKLDTNGTNPEIVKEFIEEELIDYVAMDIKASPESYEKVTKVKVDLSRIQNTIDILKDFDHEFRTTAVPSLVTKEDLLKIGEWLKGSKRFYIQQFVSKVDLLDKDLENTEPYNIDRLAEFKEMLKPYFDEVKVRGD